MIVVDLTAKQKSLLHSRGFIEACRRNPTLSLINTAVLFRAFGRTAIVGLPAVITLAFMSKRWSEDKRRKFIWNIARRYWAWHILDCADIDLRVVGESNIHKEKKYIFVSNHQSILDIALHLVCIPDARFVAKIETRRYPVIGWAVRFGGQIVIDRGNHKQSMMALRLGMQNLCCSTVIFPEGTRTPDGVIQRFKLGAFAVAHEFGVPIVPVGIRGTYAALHKGESFLALRRGARVTYTFGEPISADVALEDLPLLAEKVRMQIACMM